MIHVNIEKSMQKYKNKYKSKYKTVQISERTVFFPISNYVKYIQIYDYPKHLIIPNSVINLYYATKCNHICFPNCVKFFNENHNGNLKLKYKLYNVHNKLLVCKSDCCFDDNNNTYCKIKYNYFTNVINHHEFTMNFDIKSFNKKHLMFHTLHKLCISHLKVNKKFNMFLFFVSKMVRKIILRCINFLLKNFEMQIFKYIYYLKLNSYNYLINICPLEYVYKLDVINIPINTKNINTVNTLYIDFNSIMYEYNFKNCIMNNLYVEYNEYFDNNTFSNKELLNFKTIYNLVFFTYERGKKKLLKLNEAEEW